MIEEKVTYLWAKCWGKIETSDYFSATKAGGIVVGLTNKYFFALVVCLIHVTRLKFLLAGKQYNNGGGCIWILGTSDTL